MIYLEVKKGLKRLGVKGMFSTYWPKCSACGHETTGFECGMPFQLKGDQQNCLACGGVGTMIWISSGGNVESTNQKTTEGDNKPPTEQGSNGDT